MNGIDKVIGIVDGDKIVYVHRSGNQSHKIMLSTSGGKSSFYCRVCKKDLGEITKGFEVTIINLRKDNCTTCGGDEHIPLLSGGRGEIQQECPDCNKEE